MKNDPGPAYWLDYYGTCLATYCACNDPKNKWIGRMCGNWQPLGVQSLEEYELHVRREAEERLQLGKRA